jgi:hypothetical protein
LDDNCLDPIWPDQHQPTNGVHIQPTPEAQGQIEVKLKMGELIKNDYLQFRVASSLTR